MGKGKIVFCEVQGPFVDYDGPKTLTQKSFQGTKTMNFTTAEFEELLSLLNTELEEELRGPFSTAAEFLLALRTVAGVGPDNQDPDADDPFAQPPLEDPQMIPLANRLRRAMANKRGANRPRRTNQQVALSLARRGIDVRKLMPELLRRG